MSGSIRHILAVVAVSLAGGALALACETPPPLPATPPAVTADPKQAPPPHRDIPPEDRPRLTREGIDLDRAPRSPIEMIIEAPQPGRVEPREVCGGSTITLSPPKGSTFPKQRRGLEVLFAPCGIPGRVVKWQSERIAVEVPELAETGPVWLGEVPPDALKAEVATAAGCLSQLSRDVVPGVLPRRECTPVPPPDRLPALPGKVAVNTQSPRGATGQSLDPDALRAALDPFGLACTARQPERAAGWSLKIDEELRKTVAAATGTDAAAMCFDTCSELHAKGSEGKPVNVLRVKRPARIVSLEVKDAVPMKQSVFRVDRGPTRIDWKIAGGGSSPEVRLAVGKGPGEKVAAEGQIVRDIDESTDVRLDVQTECGTVQRALSLQASTRLHVSTAHLDLAPGQKGDIRVSVRRPLPSEIVVVAETPPGSPFRVLTPDLRIPAGGREAVLGVERVGSHRGRGGSLLGEILLRPGPGASAQGVIAPARYPGVFEKDDNTPVAATGSVIGSPGTGATATSGVIGSPGTGATATSSVIGSPGTGATATSSVIGSPGSGPGPAGVRIQATFRYRDCAPLEWSHPTLDSDKCYFAGGAPTMKLIRRARVEIWRQREAGHHSLELITESSDAGAIDVIVPAYENSKYDITLVAKGPAGEVDKKDTLNTWYWNALGTPQPAAAGSSLTFAYEANREQSMYWNALDGIYTAWLYARNRLGFTESEALASLKKVRVIHRVGSSGSALPYGEETHIWLGVDDRAFYDHTVVHEYGHHLERMNDTYQAWAGYHDGCYDTADTGLCQRHALDYLDGVLPRCSMTTTDTSSDGACWMNRPAYSWFEGFPEYFAGAVLRWDAALPPGSPAPVSGHTGALTQDGLPFPWNPTTCPCKLLMTPHWTGGNALITPSDVTDYLVGALFDLGLRTDVMGATALSPDQVESAIFRTWWNDLRGTTPMPDIHRFKAAWMSRFPGDTALPAVLLPYGL